MKIIFPFACLPLLASLLVTACSVRADEPQVPEPLEPKIVAASNEPEQSLAGIKLPEGVKGSVFAAEPDVANIVAFSVDDQGVVWVCETFRQNVGVTDNRGHDDTWLQADLSAMTVADRIAYHRRLLGEEGVKQYQQQDDRIRKVEDTDKDGRADRATVFASGFNRLEEGTGAGVLSHRGSVYYTCIPKLWRLIDKDQDGKADDRIVLYDGFGVRVAFRGHDMHGLIVGPDGRLYFSIGDRGYHVQTKDGNTFADPTSGAVFRCELDGSNLEVFATGLRNPQELAFDQYGNLFTGDNNSDSGDRARFVNVVEGGDTGWRMHYQYLPDRGPFNREKIWHPFHPEQPAYIVPPIENVADGPSGLLYYPGTGFGDQWSNTFLLADFRGSPSQSGIRAIQVTPSGAFFKLSKNEQPIWKVLATDLAFAPDGSLYISDWVDGWDGQGKGRLYRFVHTEASKSELVAEVKQLLSQDWSKVAPERLGELLSHADQRVRFNAQWELSIRGSVEPLLKTVQAKDASTLARLHAVWGLGHASRLNASLKANCMKGLIPLLDDQDAYVRAASAGVLGEHRVKESATKIASLLNDAEPRVVQYAATAASKLKDASAWQPTIDMLERNNNSDPILRHAGIVALQHIASDDDQLAKLTVHRNAAVRRAAVVALRRRKSPKVAAYLRDSDPLVVAESARAIHDVPIIEALPALAELATSKGIQDETMFRAMNACFRLGGADRAQALARVAGTHPSERLRLEALEMLSQWEAPAPRDRVINDWRPIAARSAEDALVALKSQLAQILTGSPAVQSAGTKTAAKYGITEIIPALNGLYREAASPEVRGSALLALVTLAPDQAKGLLPAALKDSNAELRVAAMKASVALMPDQAVDELKLHIDSKVATERQAAWRLLGELGDRPAAAQLLSQGIEVYVKGQLEPDVWLDVLQASEKRLPDELAKTLQEQQAKWVAADPLDAWRWAVAGGDVESGKSLFFNKAELSCVRCHKVQKLGGEVGPELTATAKKQDAKYLLESIVLPSAKIAEGFETVVLVDDAGVLHTGVLKQETPEFVEIMTADGSLKRIDVETIEARRKGNSAMPADIEKHLNRQELRDLVAYLVSLKNLTDTSGH